MEEINYEAVSNMCGNSENYQRVLAMAKEVREETDIEKVVSLLNSKEWVTIAAVTNTEISKTTFSLIRI